MPKYFRLDQAENLLPQVAEVVGQMVHLKQQHDRAGEELQGISNRVAAMGGMVVNREQLLGHRNKRDAAAMRLKEIIDEIHGWGVQVKDLDIGLIDFPSLYRDEEVCLCWKLGEKGIEFWHSATEGFRGRKPIDQEFVDNHRGDWVE